MQPIQGVSYDENVLLLYTTVLLRILKMATFQNFMENDFIKNDMPTMLIDYDMQGSYCYFYMDGLLLPDKLCVLTVDA